MEPEGAPCSGMRGELPSNGNVPLLARFEAAPDPLGAAAARLETSTRATVSALVLVLVLGRAVELAGLLGERRCSPPSAVGAVPGERHAGDPTRGWAALGGILAFGVSFGGDMVELWAEPLGASAGRLMATVGRRKNVGRPRADAFSVRRYLV
jgi:hypothetical protein